MLPHASKVSAATLGVALWLATTMSAWAQGGACTLIPDDRNPSEKIMRCGSDLVVRAAPGTRYHPVEQKNNETPRALQLDSGALMIEFHATDAQKDFQILTPHAIAAVRGTKWVVEVQPSRSSTLVISGEVAVRHLQADDAVKLGPGQGVDVSPGTSRLVVKRWARKRVRALLARFGE